MNYRWAEGSHAPKDVSAESIAIDCESRGDWSPDGLYEASKAEGHPVHEDIWAEGDQVWAQRARVERCRKIIQGVNVEIEHGGKSYEVRAAEFVHVNGDGRWVSMQDIQNDNDLLKAYAAEVGRFLQQAVAKNAKLQALMDE